MKIKVGIIMLVCCVISFIIYESKDTKTRDKKVEKLINGKITDAATGVPVEGATIAIQGTNPKSVSNAQGEYAILAMIDDELVFRQSKYKTKMVVAGDAHEVKMTAVDTAFIKKAEAGLEEEN